MPKVRTSSKLLFLIVIGALTSIVVFDLLIKQRLMEGKFVYQDTQIIDSNRFSVSNLHSFRHIVINGLIKDHNGIVVTEGAQYWRPRVMIEVDSTRSTTVDVPREIGNSVLLKVLSDTLYMSFDTKQPLSADNPLVREFNIAYIKINASRVNSIVVTNGYVYLAGSFGNVDSYLSHSIFSLDSAKFDVLKVYGEDASKLKVDHESKIGHLQYDFCHSTALVAEGAVAKFSKIKMDQTSAVNIVDTLGNAVKLSH